MSSQPSVTGPPASYGPGIHATKAFIPFGEGASKNFGFGKHIAIALTIGITTGLIWKTMHWNDRKFVAQYYFDLAKKEAKDDAAYKEIIAAKFAALEAELSS